MTETDKQVLSLLINTRKYLIENKTWYMGICTAMYRATNWFKVETHDTAVKLVRANKPENISGPLGYFWPLTCEGLDNRVKLVDTLIAGLQAGQISTDGPMKLQQETSSK